MHGNQANSQTLEIATGHVFEIANGMEIANGHAWQLI
jgi:hypothetical protein